MKRGSTFFLKAVIIFIGIAALALDVYTVWNVGIGTAINWPVSNTILYVGLIAIYTSIIPFLFALFQGFALLQNIDKDNAFSEISINALRNIKYSAVVMSIFYWAAMPLVFTFADLDDAPGVVIIGAVLASAPLVIATFAAVLQKLVQNAIDIKLENDLTV
jgi:hypothetical protein